MTKLHFLSRFIFVCILFPATNTPLYAGSNTSPNSKVGYAQSPHLESNPVLTQAEEKDTLKPCPNKPNCVNSMAAKSDSHYLPRIELAGNEGIEGGAEIASIAQNKQQLLTILSKLKNVHIIKQTEQHLTCEFTSALFKFVDDVEFIISADHIDFRSASRTGYHDMGKNKKRMEEIRTLIEEGKK